MTTYRELFGVRPGSAVRLADADPNFKDEQTDKTSAKAEIEADCERLSDLQQLLYAGHQHSLLIVLQGMDAAGKDGTIGHVFGAVNPQGTRVHQFKVPTPEEADHDFLWRAHLAAPRKGEIMIFNRSHYEGVLVERVHSLVPEKTWSGRYELINEFEKGLATEGATILKFFLHISPEEQLARFKARLDDPARRWKISEADYAERPFFKEYVTAYEDALSKTSTEYAPWFVIPANHKWFRNLAVSKIVVESLDALGMKYPAPSVNLEEIRRKYHAAAKTPQT